MSPLFEVVELDARVALAATDLRHRMRIKLLDAYILATAQVNGAILITRNTKDFPAKMPGIRIPYKLRIEGLVCEREVTRDRSLGCSVQIVNSITHMYYHLDHAASNASNQGARAGVEVSCFDHYGSAASWQKHVGSHVLSPESVRES